MSVRIFSFLLCCFVYNTNGYNYVLKSVAKVEIFNLKYKPGAALIGFNEYYYFYWPKIELMKRTTTFLATFLTGFLMMFIAPLAAQNYVTTYAGTGSSGFVNGDTSIASFSNPFGICLDQEGNVYLADAYNHCIRKISTDGEVSVYAGAGTPGYLDGPAEEAKFNQPLNICLDTEGSMYVSDFLNQRIRKISYDMEVTTVAGSGFAGWQNGPAEEARFNYPRGICLDDLGNIYIGDSWNHRIRKISVDGTVSDWAGGGDVIGVQSVGDYVDASDTAARFYTPCELSIDQYNNIYVADAYNHRIRKIDPDAVVTTVAGSGGFGPTGGGFNNGPVEEAQFNTPTACHVIPDGTIFVGDGSNQRVREISIYGYVATFAGSGEAGFDDGPDSLATFDFPRGTVLDMAMNRLYVVDYNNHAVRIIHIEPTVGYEEQPGQDEVRIYPNPAKTSAIIQFEQPGDYTEIRIRNSMGQLVLLESLNGKVNHEVDLNRLANGIYYIEFYSADRRLAMKKLVVEK
jgi:sugar lactone lactonase YvrE